MNNIKEWTPLSVQELLTRASCRKDWKRISAESSLMPPGQSNPSRDITAIENGAKNGAGRVPVRVSDTDVKTTHQSYDFQWL